MLSLQRRRKLLPWLFLAPGLAWLLIFFGIPLVNQLYVSLQTGDPETGYVFDWNFARLHGGHLRLPRAVPALDRLRGDRDGPVLRDRLPARVLHRVQGRAVQELHAAADHPAVLRQLRAADGLVAADPGRQRLGRGAAAGHRPGLRRRPAAGHAHGRDRRHHLQLPALHGAAAVRLAGEDRPAADRGGDRPLREPGDGVPQGHAAARAARPVRRHAADLHPGHGRLHQRRAAGHPAPVHDRQRHPVEVPGHPRLPDRGRAVVPADGLHPDRDLPLRPRARHPQPDRGGAQ